MRDGLDPAALAEIPEVLECAWEDIFTYRCEAQQDFVSESSRRYQLWCAARMVGKTFALALKILLLALMNGSNVRDDGSWIVGEAILAGRTAKECAKKLKPNLDAQLAMFRRYTGIPLVGSYNKGDSTYTLNNGTLITFESYGAAERLSNLRGNTLFAFGADEVAHAPISYEDFLSSISPALRYSEASEMQFFAATSPNGPGGIVGHFMRQCEAGAPDYWMTYANIFDIGLSDEEIEKLRSGVTDLMWRQEYLCEVLLPSNIVYPQFREEANVRQYVWSPGCKWGLGIDWGVDSGGAVVVVVFHANGEWDIVDEVTTSAGIHQQKADLRRLIDEWTRTLRQDPYLIGVDRALRDDNAWLQGQYPRTIVYSCKSRKEQSRSWGIPFVQWMLQPLTTGPRLWLSNKLRRGSDDPTVLPIRDALAAYRYVRRRHPETGETYVTSIAEENTPASHSCDALRYLVVVSRGLPMCHGGRIMPAALDRDIYDESIQEAA